MPGAEIMLFTTAFQAMGYLFMMAMANVCYFAGPLSESLVKPTNLDRYRRVTYQFGFWFSVLLPFSISYTRPSHSFRCCRAIASQLA